jgi:hypothetical protein
MLFSSNITAIKSDMLKLYQEWERQVKENDGGGEFNYDIV